MNKHDLIKVLLDYVMTNYCNICTGDVVLHDQLAFSAKNKDMINTLKLFLIVLIQINLRQQYHNLVIYLKKGIGLHQILVSYMIHTNCMMSMFI